MTFVYIVRCNFTAPANEQAWNDWYSGPKIAQMLAQPHFLSCQRFHRVSGTDRDYLALWTVARPEALQTSEYTSQWGFAEWERFITDWSRDLFDGGTLPSDDFAVAPGGSLEVVSFDGIGVDDIGSANAAIAQSNRDTMWLPIAGLDRHTPLIGLRTVPDLASAAPADDRGAVAQTTIYRPICRFTSPIRA